jgi:hypothetical protein
MVKSHLVWVDDYVPVAQANRAFIDAPSNITRWLSRLVGQARRQWLSRMRPRYVTEARRRRRGACRRCGSCCDLTFHCPFLTASGPCRIYKHRNVTCRDFPIDARDLELTQVPCGHYFD